MFHTSNYDIIDTGLALWSSSFLAFIWSFSYHVRVPVLVYDLLMWPVRKDYVDLLSYSAFNVRNCGQCHSNLHFDNLRLFEVPCAMIFMHYCFTEGGFLSVGFIVMCCYEFAVLSSVLSKIANDSDR